MAKYIRTSLNTSIQVSRKMSEVELHQHLILGNRAAKGTVPNKGAQRKRNGFISVKGGRSGTRNHLANFS